MNRSGLPLTGSEFLTNSHGVRLHIDWSATLVAHAIVFDEIREILYQWNNRTWGIANGNGYKEEFEDTLIMRYLDGYNLLTIGIFGATNANLNSLLTKTECSDLHLGFDEAYGDGAWDMIRLAHARD